MRTFLAASLLLCAAHPATAQAPPSAPPVKAIVGATLIDVVGGTSIPDAVIVIEGDHIAAAGPAATTSVPAGAEQIVARGKSILPGLMNLHTHLGLVLPGRVGAELANETDADLALRMAANARESLRAGITMVRLTGERGHVDFAVKRAIDAGSAEGPRIATAGELVGVTGGHGVREDSQAADGPYELRRAVRRQIHAGATWIKVAISGGIADRRGSIAASHLTKDEIEAVIDAAHRLGAKVTAHSGSAEATSAAVDAGIDCIEHGYFLTAEVLQKMKAKGTWLVPTIVVSRPTTRSFFEKIGSPEWYMQRVFSVGEQHWKTLQMAIKEGVRIGLGTDQFPFEPNDGTIATVREAQFYVEAGMTPLQAIRSATIEPATLLGMADQVGSIEKGRFADLIAVDRDPLQDISALRTISFVMKGGTVVRNDWEKKPQTSSSASR